MKTAGASMISWMIFKTSSVGRPMMQRSSMMAVIPGQVSVSDWTSRERYEMGRCEMERSLTLQKISGRPVRLQMEGSKAI